jgi:hypothetical protein
MFAAFGSMYFAVISMTDAEHRRELFAPIIDEVERTPAVRAVYLAVRATAGSDRRPGPAAGESATSTANSCCS